VKGHGIYNTKKTKVTDEGKTGQRRPEAGGPRGAEHGLPNLAGLLRWAHALDVICMKRFLPLAIIAVAAALWSASASAETPAEAKSKADSPLINSILEKNLEAEGGREAMLRVTNRVVTAQVEIKSAGMTLQGEFISSAPDKKLNIIDAPGMGRILEGYNGKVAWMQQPNMPATEKPAGALADVRIDSDFYKDLHVRGLYPQMIYAGKTNVNSRPAHQIEATPKEGRAATLYFDVDNGLLVRLDTMADTPFGKAQIQIYFEDFRTVDGIKIPFLVRQPVPEVASTVITFKSVKQNVPMDDARFNKPQ
jgi:hypothetical protein